MVPWVVGVVVGVGLVGAPSAVAFQGPWAPVVDLSASSRSAVEPEVAVAPNGSTTVFWSAGNVVQASTRLPGGMFGAPINLSVPGSIGGGPDVAVAPNGGTTTGTTTVVWRRNNVVQASTRPPSGTFGPPVVLLSAPGQNIDVNPTYWPADQNVGPIVGGPEVAVAPDGTTTVVWTHEIVTSSAVQGSTDWVIVQAVTRAAGSSTFSPPVDLSAHGQKAYQAQVAAAADGTTTVVWQAEGVVQARTRPPGGTFGPPVDLSASDQESGGAQLATAADGTTTVVWGSTVGANPDTTARATVTQASTRPPGGSFGVPITLSAIGKNAGGTQVAVAPDGTTTAIWGYYTASACCCCLAPVGGAVVQASTRPPGGSFGPPVDLSAHGQAFRAPQVAVGADGTTTAIWGYSNPGKKVVVQARTRPPGGTFGAAIDLAVAGWYDQPQVAVGADGAATAVWNVTDANGKKSVVQARFTAHPPTPRSAPTIAWVPSVRATLGCRGSAWTGAASITTTWLRGTTQIATGPSHQVTTRDRGTVLTCRTRASNPYGTTDSRSTALRIPPGPPIPPGTAREAPVARSLPTVTGTPRVGHTLRCRPGAFTGATSTSTSWLRGSRIIPGARKTTYTLTRADSGKTIACRTTANGPGGTSTTISLRTHARR